MEIYPEDLKKFESNLTEKGYVKYNQKSRNSDYQYWKIFYVENKKEYQVGVLFYDWSKYPVGGIHTGIQYECFLLGDVRIDLLVLMDITIEKFEIMASDFYEAMKKYNQNGK